MKFLLQGESVI